MAPITIKKSRQRIEEISKKVNDHSKDPFVVTKVEAAKKLIKKYRLPNGQK